MFNLLFASRSATPGLRGALILLVGLLPAAPVRGQQADAPWTQWRGPARDGQLAAAAWPDSLDANHLELLWRVDLAPGYSGPLVSGSRIFVTETAERKFEVVRALDRTTGEQLWEARWEGAVRVPFFAQANGDWIRATPAYDGERLYVAGMRDVLVCLDGNSGRELWRVDFPAQVQSPLPAFGFVSSPIVLGDYLFVQAGASLVKLNKRTGQILWRSLQDAGGMYGSAFSSPQYAVIADKPQLLVQTRSDLAGVDVQSGEVLWREEIPAFRGMNILTPTVIGSQIFTSSYGGRSLLFEIRSQPDGWQVAEVWNHKAQGYMSSPVVIDGYLYLHLRNQRLTCIDLATGKEQWTTTPFGRYWSMIASGNRILALDERGELLLIRAAPREFQLIDRRQVAQDTWAHLAVSGRSVLVRDLQGLLVFHWK